MLRYLDILKSSLMHSISPINKRLIAIFAAAAFVLLLTFVPGYFRKDALTPLDSNTARAPAIRLLERPDIGPDVTSEWLTYDNRVYGYKFSYPDYIYLPANPYLEPTELPDPYFSLADNTIPFHLHRIEQFPSGPAKFTNPDLERYVAEWTMTSQILDQRVVMRNDVPMVDILLQGTFRSPGFNADYEYPEHLTIATQGKEWIIIEIDGPTNPTHGNPRSMYEDSMKMLETLELRT